MTADAGLSGQAVSSLGQLYWLSIPLAGVAVTYLWRLLGVLFVARIDPHGPVLRWVRAVATALVAALVARMVLFPSGLLAETALAARLLGLTAGVLFWWLAGRRLAPAVGIAVLAFLLSQMVISA